MINKNGGITFVDEMYIEQFPPHQRGVAREIIDNMKGMTPDQQSAVALPSPPPWVIPPWAKLIAERHVSVTPMDPFTLDDLINEYAQCKVDQIIFHARRSCGKAIRYQDLALLALENT